jgi:hypothetical protein
LRGPSVKMGARFFPILMDSNLNRNGTGVDLIKVDMLPVTEWPEIPLLPDPPRGEEAHRITAGLLAGPPEEPLELAARWAVTRLRKRAPVSAASALLLVLSLGPALHPSMWNVSSSQVRVRYAATVLPESLGSSDEALVPAKKRGQTITPAWIPSARDQRQSAGARQSDKLFSGPRPMLITATEGTPSIAPFGCVYARGV